MGIAPESGIIVECLLQPHGVRSAMELAVSRCTLGAVIASGEGTPRAAPAEAEKAINREGGAYCAGRTRMLFKQPRHTDGVEL